MGRGYRTGRRRRRRDYRGEPPAERLLFGVVLALIGGAVMVLRGCAGW